MAVRSIGELSKPVWWLLLAGVALQCSWHAAHLAPAPRPEPLPSAPTVDLMRVAALGEPAVMSRATALWLQSFDIQAGAVIPLSRMDYARLVAWLERSLQLDPQNSYPLFLATHIYAQSPDPAQQRRMLDFVYSAYLDAPDTRWRWLAYAAVVAKHDQRDLHLAQRYARALRERGDPTHVPAWARQMELFALADLGEYDAARAVLGGVLAEGQVTDRHELALLLHEVEKLDGKTKRVSSIVVEKESINEEPKGIYAN